MIASSEATYGICFADGVVNPDFLPVDKTHDVSPTDSCGLSKVVNERMARAFAKRSGADIYAPRIGNVVEPHQYVQDFPRYFADPSLRRRNFFCYIDARDLGQIVDRCLKVDGLGYQVFNAGNDENGMNLENDALLARYFPGVPVRGDLGPREALFANRKIREVLGFREEHPWQNKWKAEAFRLYFDLLDRRLSLGRTRKVMIYAETKSRKAVNRVRLSFGQHTLVPNIAPFSALAASNRFGSVPYDAAIAALAQARRRHRWRWSDLQTL